MADDGRVRLGCDGACGAGFEDGGGARMQVIRVRHDLGPSQKALLARLGWDYVVDEDAPMCERRSGRDMALVVCRKCRRVEDRRTA